MKYHKRKRSEFTYMEIVRSLLRYYRGIEDEIAEKRYKRLWKIENPSVGKPYGRSVVDIAKEKGINLDSYLKQNA